MLNKVMLIGRLGRDPERKTTQSGKSVCTFTLATDTGYGDNKKTDWHNITVFDKTADNCAKYLHKGSPAYVEGRIAYDSYEKDGIKHTTTKIIANTVEILNACKSKKPPSLGALFSEKVRSDYVRGTNLISTSMPRPSARRLMVLRDGQAFAFSMRLKSACEIPVFLDSSCCVIPAAVRALITSPMRLNSALRSRFAAFTLGFLFWSAMKLSSVYMFCLHDAPFRGLGYLVFS